VVCLRNGVGDSTALRGVPTIAGHGLHLDSGGSEELANLGGVLNDVQRYAADNHPIQRAVVSVGVREWSGRRGLCQPVKCSAYSAAAVVDVPKEFDLGEYTVGKGPCVLVEGLWRLPRPELGGEVVVEGRQRVVSEEPRCGTMQSPVWRRTRRRFVRPQVRLPQLTGTIRQCRLHQSQRCVEVAGDALHKRIRHDFGIAHNGSGAQTSPANDLRPPTSFRRRTTRSIGRPGRHRMRRCSRHDTVRATKVHVNGVVGAEGLEPPTCWL
jgi:hypothetical protein